MADIYKYDGVVKSSTRAVGTTAVLLPGTPLASRGALQFINMGTSNLFYGGSDVTTANGFRLGVGTASPLFTDLGNAQFYAVCGDANGTVNILEIS